MNKLFVHIGHSKTGTTTLQDCLFSKHEEIAYLGRPYQNPIFENEIERLALQDSSRYHPQGLKDLINHYRQTVQEKPIVISEETFSSVKSNDRGLIADRIKTIFWPCHIIIVIRNQMDIIRSFYLNFDGLVLNLDRPMGKLVEFRRWLKHEWRKRDHGYFSEINYYDLITYYSELFGPKNVHVLLFEDFVERKEKFFGELSSLLNIRLNDALNLINKQHERKGPSSREFRYMQIKSKYLFGFEPERYVSLGSFFNRHVNNFMQKGSKPNIQFGEYDKKMQNFFREGNNRLLDWLKLPLGDYGYPL